MTAGSDGTVFMWNFNNGSRLKEFRHSEEKEELTAVLFVADDKRESDAVYAAGWNSKVCEQMPGLVLVFPCSAHISPGTAMYVCMSVCLCIQNIQDSH